MNKEELLEEKLAKDLSHTLKLVPSSQRELFVFELARYMLKEIEKAYGQGYDDRTLEADHEIEEARMEARIKEAKYIYVAATYRDEDQWKDWFNGRLEQLTNGEE